MLLTPVRRYISVALSYRGHPHWVLPSTLPVELGLSSRQMPRPSDLLNINVLRDCYYNIQAFIVKSLVLVVSTRPFLVEGLIYSQVGQNVSSFVVLPTDMSDCITSKFPK